MKKQSNNIDIQTFLQTNGLLKHYDALLFTDSENSLLDKFKETLDYDNVIIMDNSEYTITDLEEYSLPPTLFNNNVLSEEDVYKAWIGFDNILDKMYKENNNIFSLKYFKDFPYKDRVYYYFNRVFWGKFELELHKMIDGKDIIAIEDTTDKTDVLSPKIIMLKRMFEPKNIIWVKNLTEDNKLSASFLS